MLFISLKRRIETLHLLHVLLVQNLLHGNQFDDSTGAVVEVDDLAFGVGGEADATKKPRGRVSWSLCLL
jgi:hypothetical protein